jgi:hypothetical protein
MMEQPELHAQLRFGEQEQAGARELRRSLFTLPTHSLVRERDLIGIQRWVQSANMPAQSSAPLQLESVSP